MTTSSRIGEKLLAVRALHVLHFTATENAFAKGWTLLGESCPQSCCAAPLLRARTPGAKLYCPQHDGFVADAGACAAAPAAARPDASRPRSHG
jgi:hypothetical protein